jgi:diguanylate cyclase (GGDEF)-like protein
MVRHHHEWYDGTGYPDGLAGEEIVIGARILAVADVFTALTSERSYRKAWTVTRTVQHLVQLKGRQFDPEVVEAFLRALACKHGVAVSDLLVPEGVQPLREPQLASSRDRRADVGQYAVFDDIASAHQEIYALYEISQTLGTSLNLEQTLHIITAKLTSILDCSACVIYLMDEKWSELQAHAAIGEQSALFEKLHLSVGEGMTGWAVETRQPVLNGDGRTDLAGTAAEGAELRSVLAVPLITREDTLIGCLSLYHTAAGAFTEDDLHVLSIVGFQLATAIQNAMTYEETKTSALTDMLTGLPNSRYLFMSLEHEFSRARREKQPLSVLLIDLNHFKEVNDQYGHKVGDEVLREVAQLMRKQLRIYDTIARHGGDEFYVLLPKTTPDEAREIADRLKIAVAAYRHSVWNERSEREVRVGVSIGAATYPHDASEIDHLLQRADSRMYEDKPVERRRMTLVA